MEDRAMALPIHLLEMASVTLHLTILNVSLMVEIVVRIPGIMEMAGVMITIMYRSVTMMAEIAVYLMEIIGITFAKYVNVFSLLQQQLVLQHLQLLKQQLTVAVGLPKIMEMVFVMISIMYQSVTMMVEIVVDHVTIMNYAPLVLVLMEDRAMVLLIVVSIPKIMKMDFVMISIMYRSVTMMVEIAVYLMEIIGITFAKYVNVFSLPQQHLQLLKQQLLKQQLTVAIDELLCLKNVGAQIPMFFTSNE
jgi:hypothetical protein